jgi:DNA transposition AAA+ family ATPase
MQEEMKLQIIAASIEYAKQKGLSNNQVAQLSGINAGYISSMFRNQLSTTVDAKQAEISDKWFYKLAEFAQLPIKKAYWSTVNTYQFSEIIPSLETAKKTSKVSVLIAKTGSGKTYATEKFKAIHPLHTYKVTVSSVHKLPDILKELVEQLGIPYTQSNASRLRAIIEKLKELKRSGYQPIIILDEAENLELPVLKMLKGLYDGVINYSALVLIGTQQLIDKLDKLRRKDISGVPQFYRRIKAGIKHVNSSNNFHPFFEKYVEDKELRKLLANICDNYGELNDYLEPALREADEAGVPLTENFFRVMYNMPKY